MSVQFSNVPTREVVRFAAAYPFGWIVPVADPSSALLMPLLIETDAGGEPRSILGHLPRRAAATDALNRDGAAMFLFLGANAYIPPAWVSKADWAPTWNFLSLKVHASDTGIDETLTRSAVEALVDHMERSVGSDWTVEKIGSRYDELLSSIIGFRSPVQALEPRFKLGQDETPAVYNEIKRALTDHDLAGWME